MIGIIILQLIEIVVSLNVVNVVAFHGPSAFLSSIASDRDTTAYEKTTATVYIIDSIVNQIHLIKSAIPRENTSLQETIDSLSASISTPSIAGLILRICTILLKQGKNPLYFASSLVPKIVGKMVTRGIGRELVWRTAKIE